MRGVLISIVIVFHIGGGVFDGSFQSIYVFRVILQDFFHFIGISFVFSCVY